MMAAGLGKGKRDASAPLNKENDHAAHHRYYSSVRTSPSLKAEIASTVSDLTAKILRKDPKVTAIIVKSVDAADWFAGGKSLAEQSLASFWLDVHVSEGPTPRTRRRPISPRCSSAWANCSGRCTKRATRTSTRSRAMPTASAASPRSAATSPANSRSRLARPRREDSLTCGGRLWCRPRARYQRDDPDPQPITALILPGRQTSRGFALSLIFSRQAFDGSQIVASGRRAPVAPNTSSNARRSATSTSSIVTGRPRSTSEVTP